MGLSGDGQSCFGNSLNFALAKVDQLDVGSIECLVIVCIYHLRHTQGAEDVKMDTTQFDVELASLTRQQNTNCEEVTIHSADAAIIFYARIIMWRGAQESHDGRTRADQTRTQKRVILMVPKGGMTSR